MKNKFTIITLALSAVALGACSRYDEVSSGKGSFSLDVRMGEPATKAALSQEELLSSAKVSIYKGDFSGKVREYVYSQMPQSIYLPADDYRVDVVAGEIAKETPAIASWDQKSYKGSSDVKIEAGKTTNVTVVAKVSNAVSNVTFDSSLSESFEDGYTCTVSFGETSSNLVYGVAESGKDGFFIISGFEPFLSWTFSGTLKKDGSTFTKSGVIPTVEEGKRYRLNLKYIVKDGQLGFDLLVDDSTNDVYDDIIFEGSSTGIAPSEKFEIWAGHFTAHADVDETQYDKDKVFFEVRKKGSQDWTRLIGVRDSEGTFSAEVTGLEPSTEYEYQLVLTSLESGEEEILPAPNVTTDKAVPVPNGGFETTSNDESDKYKSFYDPASSDVTLQKQWWGNGNEGSTLVGPTSVICYPDESSYKEGKQSVCLQSRWVVVKFAAGNLFSGHFGDLVGTSGGTVYFGRPFTARPSALRFWMKYSGGVINRDSNNVPADGKKGNYDKASIRIALGTWDFKKYGGDSNSPVMVNTTDVSTFVDFSTDASTIAFGEKIVSSDPDLNTAKDWIEVTVPLDYRNLRTYPTHIIISCAASMYGDYFSGYDDSKLWLDGMELLYE